jgi:manganese transport protein
LPEVHGSIAVPSGGSWLRRFLAFAGPGYMISVGYMDPGNWATDLAGGSRFGYALLAVILLSNLMAILLQALAVRLGIATGRDLAQACRDHYSKPVNYRAGHPDDDAKNIREPGGLKINLDAARESLIYSAR